MRVRTYMNDKGYQISVLITFYNQEMYVDQAMSSVLNQKTDFQYKIIVGDDGSTDSTVEKVNKWKKKYPDRIEVYVQPRQDNKKYIPGSRASKNRLSLLKKVDTPYFIYLDGDDYWTDENKLSIQYETMEKKENKDCVGCAHQIQTYHEDKPLKVEKLPKYDLKEKKFSFDKYWTTYYFHTDTILFRSEAIGKLPWKIIEDSFNDNIITFCFLQFGKIYYIPKCMVAYRQNRSGIWAGEKLLTNIFRNIISYDLEVQLNEQSKSRCQIRHLVDFKTAVRMREDFCNIGEVYYDLAEKNKCKTALTLVEKGKVFSEKIWMEKLYLVLFSLRSKAVNLKIIGDINWRIIRKK